MGLLYIYHGFAPNVRKHSLHDKTNDSGWRMEDFAMARSKLVSSTLFQHRNIHPQSQRSPDSLSANQIDYVMIDSHHATDIIDVKTCTGPNCTSDHYVTVKL
jgi:endonuclease/exonuclease/phosphatase family metal-dependent hydrolase